MADNKYEFYECNNPDCQLRFPGYEGYSKSKHCPICRSSIHIAESVANISEQNKHYGIQNLLKVEGVLDNVRSAWNVGSIFRTADGTGVSKLYLCGITPTPENSKVSKTALGAEEIVHWEKSNNGVRLINNLKFSGYKLWVMEDIPDAIPLFQLDVQSPGAPIALIVGNEISGVDPGIIRICDKVVSIPMLGRKHSYNVAVAFGIASSYLLYRQIVSQGSFNILPNT